MYTTKVRRCGHYRGTVIVYYLVSLKTPQIEILFDWLNSHSVWPMSGGGLLQLPSGGGGIGQVYLPADHKQLLVLY